MSVRIRIVIGMSLGLVAEQLLGLPRKAQWDAARVGSEHLSAIANLWTTMGVLCTFGGRQGAEPFKPGSQLDLKVRK